MATPDTTAELERLRAENVWLREQVQQLLATVAELRTQVEKQQAHIEYLVKQTFGRKSERLAGPTLFDELPDPESPPTPTPTPEATTPVAAHQRRGHGRRPLPAHLPRQEQELDLTEIEKRCPCCDRVRARISVDVSERLDYQPASLFIRALVRPKYACAHCEQHDVPAPIQQAPLPPEPIPRGVAAPGLLSHLLVSKYVDHLPLYRLESIFGRLGWEVSRSTLCDHMMACAKVLTPLYALLCQRVRGSQVLHTDDTKLTLLDPRRTASAWVYLGDATQPYTVFDLTVGHRDDAPQAFLKGYTGFLQADAYAGYDALGRAGATRVGCWAHVRRYFYDARLAHPDLAHEALAYIRTLYNLEADAKKQTLDTPRLTAYRQQHALPVLTNFAAWLAEQSPRVLPKSKLGEAFTYATNQWATLTVYATDGRLAIDNNPAEQALRPLAVGRKNWLHIGGDGGLQPTAVLLSLAASAKRHAVNPWEYFKDLLTELPARPPNADLTDLLPDRWAKQRAGPTAHAA
jgi:transposase